MWEVFDLAAAEQSKECQKSLSDFKKIALEKNLPITRIWYIENATIRIEIATDVLTLDITKFGALFLEVISCPSPFFPYARIAEAFTPSLWLNELLSYIEFYTNRATDTKLLRYIKKYTEEDERLQYYVLDAIQVLYKKGKKEELSQYLGSIFKCAFLNVYIPQRLARAITLYNSNDGTREEAYYFIGRPRDWISGYVLIYRDRNYKVDGGSFILFDHATGAYSKFSGDSPEFRYHRGRINSNIEIVPKSYFKMYWKKSSCGHYFDTAFGRCVVCSRRISATGKIINSYSTRAPDYLGFKGEPKKGKFEASKIFYGAELELENGGEKEAILLYQNLKDFIIIKSDGSVRTGFEIVTAPATFEIQEKNAAILFEAISKTKMLPAANCGLHFHVSRNALTPMQIGKILEFLYNPDNKKFITDIAGRADNSYCVMTGERTITDMAPDKYHPGERYQALNLTNTNTIEFRIFASTNVFEIFMHRLEFVKSLIDYTKPAAVALKKLSDIKLLDVYHKFLKDNKKEYPYLIDFLGYKKPIPPQFSVKGSA